MPSFTFTLLTAFGLVFVIEGLLYALFPDGAQKLMAIAASMPAQNLRILGLLSAATGVAIVYFLKTLHPD